MTEEDRTTMRVILCKPDEKAVVIEMEDSLESMQNVVGFLCHPINLKYILNLTKFEVNQYLLSTEQYVYNLVCFKK